ncbi:MAG: ATP-binding protein [Sterolibacterium sp.]|nr:ATP-binding protein [Sterolibacterium sp.]
MFPNPKRILINLLPSDLLLGLLICAILANPLSAQSVQETLPRAEQKNILLLYSYGHGGRGIQIFDDGFLAAINAAGISANRLYYEFLDLERRKEDRLHRARLRDQLLAKYAYRKIGLIITVQQPALGFLLNEGKLLAPTAPAITVQAPMPAAAKAGNRRFISLLAQFDIKGTLDRALELFPNTRRVVFVGGSSEADRKMAAEAVKIATALPAKPEIETTGELALDDLLKRVAHLPPHTVILFLQYNRDIRGRVTLAYEVEGMIVKAANAPVFGLYDFNLVNGGIGGSVINVKTLGEKAGVTAIDILNGKLQLTQPVTHVDNQAVPIFDWAQIQRWGGEPDRLPDHSVFLNRIPTFWEEHKTMALGLTIIFLLQSLTIIALIRNRHNRKLIEEQLREYQTRLENMVRQRTAELSAALAAAQLADRTKDEFLANISHELRTPLNAVIGLSSLARDLTTDAKQRDYLDKIATSGKHLAHIINDLLDLSKIAAGRMAFESIPFSLRKLVSRSNSVMAHKAAEKGLTLVEHIDEAVPDILVGDPLRLEQILFNLIGNAVKFTPSGGIEVRIGLHAREKNRVCLDIEVADTGIGIRQEDLERLFKPFSQADASMSRKYGGTGLGLVISRRLAKMMDGDISVESREGNGTTFRVRLWLSLGEAGEQSEGKPSAGQETPPLCYRNTRVLVVEDQPMNREIVAELLGTVGIATHMANNGQEALDILGETGPAGFDLILMDIQMPVMDGLTATRAIRARTGFEQLPIIAMSAHTMTHEIEASRSAGMNDHIGKPFDATSFHRILAKWLPRSKHQASHSSPFKGEAGRGMGLDTMQTTNPIPHLTSPLTGEEPSIDIAAGLTRFAGNETRYHHWLADFVANAPGYASEIRQSLAAGQQDAARKSVHALKGRVGMLGMNDLHTIASALDIALKQDDPAEELLDRMERAVARASKEIRTALGLAQQAASSSSYSKTEGE